MCGISGFISKNRITEEQLRLMNDSMYHRGPDDSGVEIYSACNGYGIGFAQRRLSILDLSPMGHQPMHSNNGRISVVYNGEIYNFNDIKKKLSGDYQFRSNCDTEVIIASYLKWGIECVSHFNGMFAIAIYDRDENCVYFVRDRIGKKPLYYEVVGSEENFEAIYFGSELKPIMLRPGFEKKINTKEIARFLSVQYINAPESVFLNVYKLEPGSIMKADLSSSTLKKWKYWDIETVYQKMQEKKVENYQEAKDVLKALLRNSVSSRMISDVPLGAFLSGGYDSSLMTAMAQEASQTPVKTFTIGFDDERYNEAKYAKEVAEYLGTDHTELYISEKDMFDLVEKLPEYYDEPLSDSSQIATMLVSKLAKNKVTVALSGDGGDEFFCGYNVYDKVGQAQKLDSLGKAVYSLGNLPGLKQADILSRLPFKARMIANNHDAETKTQFGISNYMLQARNILIDKDGVVNFPFETKYKTTNWQTKRMLLDMDTYLPGDILCKVDRASMMYSLESRCPILDKDVMEYSFRIDHSFKYDKGCKKRILKDIAYDYIPKNLLDRPKVGFAVPIDSWLRNQLKEELLSMTDYTFLSNQNIFDVEETNSFINRYLVTGDKGPSTGSNYSKLVWSYFVFQKWYKHYMEV